MTERATPHTHLLKIRLLYADDAIFRRWRSPSPFFMYQHISVNRPLNSLSLFVPLYLHCNPPPLPTLIPQTHTLSLIIFHVSDCGRVDGCWKHRLALMFDVCSSCEFVSLSRRFESNKRYEIWVCASVCVSQCVCVCQCVSGPESKHGKKASLLFRFVKDWQWNTFTVVAFFPPNLLFIFVAYVFSFCHPEKCC